MYMRTGQISDIPTRVDRAAESWTPSPGAGLIGTLLIDQADLTAVERFSQYHEDAPGPLQGRYYSALLPATPPGPGQQLAFEVDLDLCSGCKACVATCHALNGLGDSEAWRDVGLLVGTSASLPVIQHVTSACHHCVEPACMSACPVEAYEKDPHTGIVRHLDDQCIGCQYCTLACPYDAPKYQPDLGIVRKCDMCSDRLQAGEAPACVQACPHEAIRIRVVDVAEVVQRAEAGTFLSSTPDPGYTQPSTVYLSARPLSPDEVRSADDHRLRPEHAHMPLVAMLVLTQLSVGGFLVEFAARFARPSEGLGTLALPVLCLAFGFAGLAASLLHLGRPLYAYRAVLGLRHSWLSREILAFGIFAKLAGAYVALRWVAPDWSEGRPFLMISLLGAVIVAGVSGVACSVMVYHVVRRPFWRARLSGPKFAGTTVVLGLALALTSLGAVTSGPPGKITKQAAAFLPPIAFVLIAATCLKLWFESRATLDADESTHRSLWKTNLLLRGWLKRPAGLRRFLGLAGGVMMPMFAAVGAISGDPGAAIAASVLALTATLCGELTERYLFFTAVVKMKMPGGPLS